MTAGAGDTVAVIDGGKSQLRLVIDGPCGRWTATSPGFAHRPGHDDVTAIMSTVEMARAATGYDGSVQRVCAGLTGAPADPASRERLRAALAKLFGAAVQLVADGVLAHAGALDGPGVVICGGTGAIAIAFDRRGRWARTDGWGYLLGDRGSGFAIGRAGLAAALAAVDGAGPDTALTDPAAVHLGGLDVAAMQDLLRAKDIPARVASFAIAVMEHAEAGDTVAAEIVRRAAHDLAATAAAAARTVGLPTELNHVSYSGRLFDTGRLLLQELADQLSTCELLLVRPRGDALTGGLALARRPRRPPYHLLPADTHPEV